MNIDDIRAMGIRKFSVFMRHGDLLSMNIYDLDLHPEDPIYMLTLSAAGQKRLVDLIAGEDEAIFALATPADVTSMNEGGERPPGY